MDKKILKYKVKKQKLANEILNVLYIKKTNYENDITNSNNSQAIINQIENYLNVFRQEQNTKLLIIVNGIYSVGKSTFINHFENYIKKISKIILNPSNITIKKISPSNTNVEIIDNIIIAEINDDYSDNNCFINIISNKISELTKNNVHTININILPKNKNSLKNKYINKIICDINDNTSNFVNRSIFTDDNTKITLKKNINSLKLKKNNIYSDEDFIFLDEIVEIIFNYEPDKFLNNKFELSNVIKFYL